MGQNGSKDQEEESDSPYQVTESPAGIKAHGKWEDVVQFSEYFTEELEEEYRKEEEEEKGDLTKIGNSEKDLQNWKDWQPQESDDKEKLQKKTAHHAKFEGDTPPQKDFQNSLSQFKSGKAKLKDQDHEEASKHFWSAFSKALKAGFTATGNFLGELEGFLYRFVLTRTNPLYFDSELISAKLDEKKDSLFGSNSKDRDQANYELTIKVHNRRLHKAIRRSVR